MTPVDPSQLAEQLERRPIDLGATDLRPYLDVLCVALIASGVTRVHVDYTGIGPRRSRSGPPRREPSGPALGPEISRLVLAVADRLVEPPRPGGHVFMPTGEVVTIDPASRPRARVHREGTEHRVVDVSGLDDPELQGLLDDLRATGADEVKAVFRRDRDGRASIESTGGESGAEIESDALRGRLQRWAVRLVEGGPSDPSAIWVGGFVLVEVGRNAGALHERTRRLLPTGRVAE